MLTGLSAYYDRHGINTVGFRCSHQSACRATSPRFTTAKASYVGPEYEAGHGPRLLFLSLDSGIGVPDPTERTIQAVRRQTLACDVDGLPKGRHWYQTHEMAWLLLRPFHPDLTIRDSRRYFAHVNSAKCCANNEGKSKASGVLFRNCREFIPGELQILQPDSVVTQGAEARDVIVKACGTVKEHERREINGAAFETGVLSLVPGKPTLWLQTYHPNNYGKFWPQKKQCWLLYVTKVGEFMAQRGVPD